jgi:DNA-binding transcriptional MerR regulator
MPQDGMGSRQREGQVDEEEPTVLISGLAEATGVSARALRHYEDRGLLVPARDNNGYRNYAESDVIRVAQIQTMISAGLGTSTIHQYFDCARTGDHGTTVELCPSLQADLDSLATRLKTKQADLQTTQQRLRNLVPVPGSL